MYFESVLLLVSLGVIVPYAFFSIVSSLIYPTDQDIERKYGSKPKTYSNTLVTGKQIKKTSLPAQKEGKSKSAIVKVTKTSAIVKRS